MYYMYEEEYDNYITNKQRHRLEKEMETLVNFKSINNYAYHQESDTRIEEIKDQLGIL